MPDTPALNKNQATIILNASDMFRQKTLCPKELKQFIGAKLAAMIETLGGWDRAVAEARRQWPMLI